MSDLFSGALGGLLKNVAASALGGNKNDTSNGGDTSGLLGMLGGLIPGDSLKDVASIAGHLGGALGQVPISPQAQSIASIAKLAIPFVPTEIVQKLSQYAPMLQLGLKTVMGNDVPPVVTGLLSALAPSANIAAPTGTATGADIQSAIGALDLIKKLVP